MKSSKTSVGAALTLALAAGVAAWLWVGPRSELDLAPVLAEFESGRVNEGEVRLRALLSSRPADPRGNLLLAAVVLARQGDQAADEPTLLDTLDRLRRLQTEDRSVRAQVSFLEGVVCDRLKRLADAEAAWKQALSLDKTSEAGWRLLGLYESLDRAEDRRALALRLCKTHPSKADKRLALVELVRVDVHRPAAAGIIAALAPIVEKYPLDPVVLMALGQALAREGKADEGVRRLQEAVSAYPESSEAWEALLNALEDAGRVEDLTKTLSLAPRDVLPDAGRARYEGWLAQMRGDWSNAVAAYRRACQSRPDDAKLLFRRSRVTRLAGDRDEADRLEQSVRDVEAAGKQLRALYEQHERELRDDEPHPALFQEVAGLKERLGRREEARNWHALVLLDRPDDPLSRAAFERLR